MLVKFSGSNYKAFESFDLDLKPLTILLGANSCGKSAILNSFLMLAQSIDSASRTETPFRLNGSRVGMGESLNIVKDKNPNNTLSFTFELDDQTSIKALVDTAKKECIEVHLAYSRFIFQSFRRERLLNDKAYSILNELEDFYYGNDSFNNKQLKKISSKICSLIRFYRANKDIINSKTKISTSKAIQNFVENVSYQRINDCLVGLLTIPLSKLAAQKIDFTFSYSRKKDCLKISTANMYNKVGERIISLKVDRSSEVTITSDIIDNDLLKRSKKDLAYFIDLTSLISFNNEISIRASPITYFSETINPVAIYLSKVLSASMKELKSSFNGVNINHVSPLRAFPQRYYLLDKAIYHNQLNALDGTELAEVLKNNENIKDSINELLAEFNLAVEVERVNDVIHKITVNQNAVNLELTDVGFGISQVLPILVQAHLSPPHSITIIEQPEIHLHPKMQAWLTDALIKIALSSSKKFIIETHSDALVRRIRLRIVDDESPLSENDLSMYYLERDKLNNRTSMRKIPVSPDGDITWPSEFMDVEIIDTLEIQQKKLERMLKEHGVQ
ncbi:AAA family ATPase [Pantoea piersonii]|uniref:AAA family ATPase n=1 Tax=Pantoea piersonii TaxID=2364647 RepID=UPI002897F0D9|nr:AAA family ATPase [Pantoea piersonii]